MMARSFLGIWSRKNGFIKPCACAVCGELFLVKNASVCPVCLYELPKNHLAPHQLSPLVFATPEFLLTENVITFCIYVATSPIRSLIHQIKYGGRTDIAFDLGQALGHEVVRFTPSLPYDAIVPVPLHPRRMRKRGYNQAEHIAQGVSAVIKRPVWKLLRRWKNTGTQTQKRDRLARRASVSSIFELAGKKLPADVHLLVVDDVITTGATIGECVRALRCDPSVRITVASVATAPGLFGTRVNESSLLSLYPDLPTSS